MSEFYENEKWINTEASFRAVANQIDAIWDAEYQAHRNTEAFYAKKAARAAEEKGA